ncbi:MAG: amidohydrolase family protein [Gammaproteobacteria bacterium]|nr:amidohydrolase family protein [Gammaproteobacteria bacterium]
MVHAQTVREDQLDAMAELGIVPSFFSAHTFYWGDWHRRMVLGPERADRISPTASAQRRGMRFTVHHDAPVIRPDALRVIQSTVTRRTRSGDILGPEQRVDRLTALKATTLDAAWQAFEENARGSIEVGKHADFAPPSGDPLTTAPDRLVELEVLGTVKNGSGVYRAAGARQGAVIRSGAPGPDRALPQQPRGHQRGQPGQGCRSRGRLRRRGRPARHGPRACPPAVPPPGPRHCPRSPDSMPGGPGNARRRAGTGLAPA